MNKWAYNFTIIENIKNQNMIFPYLTLSTMFYKVVIKKLYVSELNACLFYIIVVSYERSESKVNLELPCSFPCLVLKPLRL